MNQLPGKHIRHGNAMQDYKFNDKKIYDEIMKKMIPIYGEESVWLLSLKEAYGEIVPLEKTDIEKQEWFSDKLKDVVNQLKDFYLQMLNDLPLMLDAR